MTGNVTAAVTSDAVDPGAVDPGAVDPGTVDPGTVDPGAVDPGAVATATTANVGSGCNSDTRVVASPGMAMVASTDTTGVVDGVVLVDTLALRFVEALAAAFAVVLDALDAASANGPTEMTISARSAAERGK